VLDCIEELLSRRPDLIPTESNVLRILEAGISHDASGVLDWLFACNPALTVTEQMLKNCRNPVNLSFLLSRETTGDQGLVLSLMGAVVEESKDLALWEMLKLPARLAVLLDHAPRAKLSGKVIGHIMQSGDLGNIGRILDRDPDASLTAKDISTMIGIRKTVALQRDFVDFLRKHHDRYSMSDVRLAVGSLCISSEDDELQTKNLYHDLAGWS